MIARFRVVEVSRSYIGVRFRHKGRDRNGVDCVGLLIAVGREVGLPIADTDQDYQRTPGLSEAEIFRERIRSQSKPGSVNNIRPGSIALFKQALYPCHCGILVPQPGRITIIHSLLKKRGVVEETFSGSSWEADLIEVREFNGVI